VTSDDELLDLIRHDLSLGELLWEVCEFHVARADHGEPVRLSSGQPLQGIAGDFTGGTFFLCGEPHPIRPFLYASSEGQAGLIGHSLAEALEIMIGLPYWRDCLKFSGDGDLTTMRSAADFLQSDALTEQPEIASQRAQLSTALSLDQPPVSLLLDRLREAVAETASDVLLATETGEEYETLFGPWLPSRNPLWNRPQPE